MARLAKGLLKISFFLGCCALFLPWSLDLYRLHCEAQRRRLVQTDRQIALQRSAAWAQQLVKEGKKPDLPALSSLLEAEPNLVFLALQQGKARDQYLAVHHRGRILQLPGTGVGIDLSQKPQQLAVAFFQTPSSPLPYLEIIGVPLVLPKSGSGQVKFGFFIPGQRDWKSLNVLATLISQSLAGLAALCLLTFGLSSAIVSVQHRRQRKKETAAAVDTGDPRPPALDLLQATNGNKSLGQSDPLLAPPAKKSSPVAKEDGTWVQLYNEVDLSGWKIKGNAYANSEVIVTVPRITSLVRQGDTPRHFIYRLQGCKISGADGFVVLLPLAGKWGVWVIGGWGNRFSELARVEGTRRPFKVERLQWYSLEVQVHHNTAFASIDGQEMWRIDPGSLPAVDFSREFLEGLGFGCWNTLCKYRSLALKELPD